MWGGGGGWGCFGGVMWWERGAIEGACRLAGAGRDWKALVYTVCSTGMWALKGSEKPQGFQQTMNALGVVVCCCCGDQCCVTDGLTVAHERPQMHVLWRWSLDCMDALQSQSTAFRSRLINFCRRAPLSCRQFAVP